MLMRAAVLTNDSDRRRFALLKALTGSSVEIEVRALRPNAERAGGTLATAAIGTVSALGRQPAPLSRLLARLPFGHALQLALYRPDLVISEGFGAKTVQAALYRSLARRSRLLLCATEPPRRFGLVEKVILSRADGVLADGEAVAHAVEQLRFPSARIFSMPAPYDAEVFLSCPKTRTDQEAYRLVYAGDLSPQSGAADFLICLAAWAERHPNRPAEIWWIGEGDLSGVLDAQPLPDTMSQRFLGRLDAGATAAAFASCGLLVVPALTDDRRSLVAEALAAGLPVLGSRRSRRVRQLVRDDLTGWTFDPLRPEDMLRALDRALGISAEELDVMRETGRALVRPATSQGFAELVHRAVAAVLPDGALDPEIALSAR